MLYVHDYAIEDSKLGLDERVSSTMKRRLLLPTAPAFLESQHFLTRDRCERNKTAERQYTLEEIASLNRLNCTSKVHRFVLDTFQISTKPRFDSSFVNARFLSLLFCFSTLLPIYVSLVYYNTRGDRMRSVSLYTSLLIVCTW